jgi:hypothetical protein
VLTGDRPVVADWQDTARRSIPVVRHAVRLALAPLRTAFTRATAVIRIGSLAPIAWSLARAGPTNARCSLAGAYALVIAAIVMLGTASALAAIAFTNPPLLAAAIALVLTVSFVLIPQIKSAVQSYDRCMGPSEDCRIDTSDKTLGQAGELIAVAAWTVALALQIIGLFELGSIFLAWLGLATLGTSAFLQWGGVISNSAAAVVLVGFLTNLASYESCRNHESANAPAPAAA